ncbi:EAL domain-containing protein [Oxalobacteraceae bacterium OM1]|nr:EAL domain-containing protein [Oxalobacteraceae bacterium OM1]
MARALKAWGRIDVGSSRYRTDILEIRHFHPIANALPLANMNVKPLTVVTVLAAIVGALAPVALSAYLAREEATRTEKDRALFYALDVLERSEAVTDQIDIGIKRLVASHESNPCSASSQALMKEIDLSSSYIQAIGHIAANRILCSSLGAELDGQDLGPVDMVRPSGVRLWLNVRFPFAKDVGFLAVERDGFVAIVHKNLPIDTTTHIKGAALATIAYPEARVITGSGHIESKWIQAVAREPKAFIDEKYVVAVAAPRKYFIGAICALPIAELDRRIYANSLVTIPAGLLASLLLAWAIFQIAQARTAMPAVIKCALKRREFFLEYQPLVELSTGKWMGAEALIRWRRMKGEVVKPDVFIPVAEESGLIQQVSQYVVDEVAAEAGELFRRFPDFHIGINLAAADLHDDGTVLMLRKLVEQTGAHPSCIVIEATERSFTDHNRASDVIARLRSEGFPVAIDDFGTGYSSLSYLERIKFNYLKIDKSFVDTLNTDAPTSEVILHIISMAKSLNIEMIAEGVETEQQAQFLRERGVQYAQGWLYGRPMPLSRLLHTLQAHDASSEARDESNRRIHQ